MISRNIFGKINILVFSHSAFIGKSKWWCDINFATWNTTLHTVYYTIKQIAESCSHHDSFTKIVWNQLFQKIWIKSRCNVEKFLKCGARAELDIYIDLVPQISFTIDGFLVNWFGVNSVNSVVAYTVSATFYTSSHI